ncbi:hypothetical protein MBLNU230_g4611t1 [Neophaeotheca triangularis]
MPSRSNDNVFTVLVTGANSGLGFGTCCRLIDDFLATRPAPQTLHLLFTTRSPSKNAATLDGLKTHLRRRIYQRGSSSSSNDGDRIKLEGLSVELTNLASVKSLAQQLRQRHQRIDAAVWNAGIGGWGGINWFKAVWLILTDVVYATTFPAYQYGLVGLKAGDQGTAGAKGEEPVLGQVFTANVFGHYMLTHWLAPVLHEGSRVVWTSSVSARDEDLRLDDLQGLHTDRAYESSKRLTDLLVLTSDLPSTRRWTESFLPADETSTTTTSPATNPSNPRPKMYLTHPGICGTAISDIPAFLTIFVTLAFQLARLLGSPWHNIKPYKGASSTVACVLSPSEGAETAPTSPSPIPSIASSPSIPEDENAHGKAKWGSSCAHGGAEAVVRTEAEGWGFGGRVGEVPEGSMRSHMPRGIKEAGREAREGFEETGRVVWRLMEEMRVEWEGRLGSV